MIDYAQYTRELRHELHQCPEIGFDLPRTTAIVRRELDAMGVEYTEKIRKSGLVATINPGKADDGRRGLFFSVPQKARLHVLARHP